MKKETLQVCDMFIDVKNVTHDARINFSFFLSFDFVQIKNRII